eukprot:5095801-Amphidinium_carterae.1
MGLSWTLLVMPRRARWRNAFSGALVDDGIGGGGTASNEIDCTRLFVKHGHLWRCGYVIDTSGRGMTLRASYRSRLTLLSRISSLSGTALARVGRQLHQRVGASCGACCGVRCSTSGARGVCADGSRHPRPAGLWAAL